MHKALSSSSSAEKHELPHPYIEYALGGLDRRNNICKLEDFKLIGSDPVDCYRSVLRFPEIINGYVQANEKSVKGYKGSAKADDFKADFDDEDDLERSLRDARDTVLRWEAVYGVYQQALRYFFSGHKGIHVEIPGELFGGFEPDRNTAARMRVVAELLLGDSETADMSIYDTTRLWRLANTKNSKSGHYKVELTASEFFNLSIDEIKELATNPRTGSFSVDAAEFDVVEPLRDLWRESADSARANSRSPKDRINFAEVLSGLPEGERDDKLYRGICKLRHADIPEEWAEKLAREAAANCDPPFSEDEALEKVRRVYEQFEPGGESNFNTTSNGRKPDVSNVSKDVGEVRTPYPLSDLGNAERLVARHGAGLRYCHNWGKWLVWDERRWVVDATGAVRQMARQTVRSIYEEASGAADEAQRKAVAKWAISSEAKTRIDAMIGLTEAELGIPVTPDKLDADPWLLNVLNGTIDLRTGELRRHQREDLITKLAPVEYDPEAFAPTWQTFLEHVQPNEQVRGFLKRSAGYSATGDTSEQCMFIDSGSGANGKSTYHEALHATLGDYALRTPAETLLAKRAGGVPNDIARLKGARLVTASETDEGRRLNESLIKDLTGQDTISARFMRAEWFDFKPTHKLHLATNHKPEIRGTDPAIWRRIRLIPWAVTIPPSEQDRRLPEKLKAERSGVLRWLIEGAREWTQEGLNAPDEVRLATKEYRADQDVLAAFLDDCCVVLHYETAFAGKLWNAWQRWCEGNGEVAGSQKRFGGKLKERGFVNDRDSATRRKVWYGLALRSDWEERAELDHEKTSLLQVKQVD